MTVPSVLLSCYLKLLLHDQIPTDFTGPQSYDFSLSSSQECSFDVRIQQTKIYIIYRFPTIQSLDCPYK